MSRILSNEERRAIYENEMGKWAREIQAPYVDAGLVDRGEQCPGCHRATNIERVEALGIPLFCCTLCGTSWFDCVTQPTQEAA
jgi:hypothetical protein